MKKMLAVSLFRFNDAPKTSFAASRTDSLLHFVVIIAGVGVRVSVLVVRIEAQRPLCDRVGELGLQGFRVDRFDGLAFLEGDHLEIIWRSGHFPIRKGISTNLFWGQDKMDREGQLVIRSARGSEGRA